MEKEIKKNQDIVIGLRRRTGKKADEEKEKKTKTKKKAEMIRT